MLIIKTPNTSRVLNTTCLYGFPSAINLNPDIKNLLPMSGVQFMTSWAVDYHAAEAPSGIQNKRILIPIIPRNQK